MLTIDETSREGFQWEHLFLVLPFMARYRRGVRRLVVRIAGGAKGAREIVLSGKLLEQLSKLSQAARDRVLKKLRHAKSKDEAVRIIEDEVRAASKGKAAASATAKSVRGPGRWLKVAEAMSPRARAYQAQITGRADEVYLVSSVKFDGFRDGTLLDAKGPGYENFIDDEGYFRYWFKKESNPLIQAKSQLEAANGIPIEWHIADAQLFETLKAMFVRERISGIKLFHTLPK